jgi:hypothetical protein
MKSLSFFASTLLYGVMGKEKCSIVDFSSPIADI